MDDVSLVLGIGNSLLSDEGAGIHAVRRLQGQARTSHPQVRLLDGGTLSFPLVEAIADARDLIVIDAAQLAREPGAVGLFEGEEMDHFLATGHKRSVHEVGLVDLMSMARLCGTLPARRALVAIQPAEFGWGEQPSAPVASAIISACDLVGELLERWRDG
jgi:hydrogenase maturation protease